MHLGVRQQHWGLWEGGKFLSRDLGVAGPGNEMYSREGLPRLHYLPDPLPPVSEGFRYLASSAC